jgi:hypothetical protein
MKYKTIIPKEEPKQETLEEVAERLYPVNKEGNLLERFGLKYVANQKFIEGAKRQQEKYDLLLIALTHTKTLLASCEKALEDSFKKEEEIEKLKIDTKEEEIKDLKSRLDVAKESSAKALKMIEDLEEQDNNKYSEEEVIDLLNYSGKDKQDLYDWFKKFKKK